MGNMGISFEIPNGYSCYLYDILKPLQVENFQWLRSRTQVHRVKEDKFPNLFDDQEQILSGERLIELAKNNIYYIIFLSLIAFSKDRDVEYVKDFQEFLNSDCQIYLGIYDCSEVFFWSKDQNILSEMYNHVKAMNYMKVVYMDEKELIQKNYITD